MEIKSSETKQAAYTRRYTSGHNLVWLLSPIGGTIQQEILIRKIDESVTFIKLVNKCLKLSV